MIDARTLAAALLDDVEYGNLPGFPIRHQGEEIWLHTTGQVQGWLRTYLEKAGLIEADDFGAPAPSASVASSARPASPETGSDGSRVHD